MSLFDNKLWKENALFSVRETGFFGIGMLLGLLAAYFSCKVDNADRPKSSTLCDYESVKMKVESIDYRRGVARLNNVLVVNGGYNMIHCTNRETERLLKRARITDMAELDNIILPFMNLAPPFLLEKTNDSTFYVYKYGDTLTFGLECES